MEEIKKFLIKFIVLGVMLLIPIMVYNYITDTYAVLRRDASNIVTSPNDKYVKLTHVIKHKDKYDSFLFGSSRAGHIHVNQLKDGKYYNMYYWSGIPIEWLRSIKVLLKNNIKIKNIILAIDEFSYTVNPELRYQEYVFRFYPEGFFDTISFYSKYLFKQPDLIEFFNMQKPVAKWGLVFDYNETGNYYITKLEKEIEADPEKHINSDKFVKAAPNEGNRIDAFIKEVSEIKKICDTNNIKLVLLFNPINKINYFQEDIDKFNTVKKRIIQIDNFYDFSGLNSVTENNYYYTDVIHFRPKVGDMMLAKIFGTPPAKVPKDFGVYITKDNIEAHLKFLKEQMDNYKRLNKISIKK